LIGVQIISTEAKHNYLVTNYMSRNS